MSFRIHRRLIALVTAILFGFSVADHGFLMGDMSTKMAAAAVTMDMSSANVDMGYGEDNPDARMACFALCASSVGVFSDPAEPPIVISFQRIDSPPLGFLLGRNATPDPYPPKPVVLV